jgi:hypothetical protein
VSSNVFMAPSFPRATSCATHISGQIYFTCIILCSWTADEELQLATLSENLAISGKFRRPDSEICLLSLPHAALRYSWFCRSWLPPAIVQLVSSAVQENTGYRVLSSLHLLYFPPSFQVILTYLHLLYFFFPFNAHFHHCGQPTKIAESMHTPWTVGPSVCRNSRAEELAVMAPQSSLPNHLPSY